MAFLPYEIVPASDTGSVELISPCALSTTTFNGTGKIKDFRANRVSIKCLNRLFLLFGLKRLNADAKVDVTEIAAFLEHIGSYDISNVNFLGKFIEEFGLEWLYTVNEDPLEKQLSVFFAKVRAVVPFRLAAYDGRHRFNLCCYFATGLFHPTSSMHPTLLGFDAKFPGKLLRNCAVFKHQRFRVSLPIDEQPFQSDLNVLRTSGSNITASQSLVVETTFEHLVPDIIEHLLKIKIFDRFTPMGVDEYWSSDYYPRSLVVVKDNKLFIPKKSVSGKPQGFTKLPTDAEVFVVDKNLNLVLEAVLTYISASSDRVTAAKGVSSKKGWDEIKTAMLDKKHGSSHLFGLLGPPNGKNDIPVNLTGLMCTMRLLTSTPEHLVLWRRYLQLTTPQTKQRPMLVEDRALYRTMYFFNWCVLQVTARAVDRIVDRYVTEKAFITHARTAKQHEGLAMDIKAWDKETKSTNNGKRSTTTLTFENSLSEGAFKILAKTIASGQKVNDTNVKTKTSSKVTKKLSFATFSSSLVDVLEVFVLRGFNGILKRTGTTTTLLHFYLE
jgi:hypothetical protein